MGTSINISFPVKYRGRVQGVTHYLQQEIFPNLGHPLYLAKARSNQTVHGRVASPAVGDEAKSGLHYGSHAQLVRHATR